MKKALMILILAVVAQTATASEQIKITWPFGPVAATLPMRAQADQANQSQKDLTFVMDFKTGGGGSIAVASVTADRNSSILAHSGAFFINPVLADSATYNVNDWRMIDYLCDLPFVVASKKYKSFNEITRAEVITVGHLGVGTTTHLVSEAMRKKFPNMILVPYKTAAQAGTDLLGGHVDLIVSLPGDTIAQQKAGNLNILAVTGPDRIESIPTLGSFGIANADDIVSGYFYFVPRSAPVEKVRQWQTVLNQSKTAAVKAIMEKNYCRPSTVSPAQYDAKFVQLRDFWARETQAVKK
jgi:tripartite-type tricarboxylate transporter receptor subunit TctC